MKTMTLKSTAFGPNETIPRRHTEDGQNVSPPLAWSEAPQNAHEFALIVDDPDAPRKDPWVHWVLYRISPETRELPEGVPPSQRIAKPGGAVQGKNSWDRIGWGGPAPPKGHGLHHYHFKLYALDMKLNLDPGATKEALLEAMHGHVIAEGELVGTYQR